MSRYTPIPREEALALLALAREVQPPGETVSFMPSAKQVRAARAALARSLDNVEIGANRSRDDIAKLGWLLEALGAVFVRQGGLQAVVFRP